MLDGFRASLRIGLARSGIALAQCKGWKRARTTPLSETRLTVEDAAAPERVATRLGNTLAEAGCKGRPATLIFADEWTRLFMVVPPQNTIRLQDCRAAAEMRFQVLYGESPEDWYIEADWNAHHPFLACAIPRKLQNALHRSVAEHRVTLIEMVPQFIAAWNRRYSLIRPDAWFGIAQADMLTLAVVQERRLCALRVAPVPAGGWRNSAWLPSCLVREAIRLNVPPPGRIQLCGEIPGEWRHQTLGQLICDRLDSTPPGLSPAMALVHSGSRA
jgi:hypothetical protein